MKHEILKTLALILLLALPTSAQTSQEHLTCKHAETGFTGTHDTQVASQPRRIQGIPGKRGATGVKGDRGIPGIKGEPGIPAAVDYERIHEVIDEKNRQCQACKERNGIFYEGNCYFVPYVTHTSSINYAGAVQKCNNAGSKIAEIYSRNQQQALEDFVRSTIPSNRGYNRLWIATLYQRLGKNLRFRSGKEVSISQLKWHSNYPLGSGNKLVIIVFNDGARSSGLYNKSARSTWDGVMCQI